VPVHPGLVWRRDAIDRLHVGEPHQLDLWARHRATMTPVDLEAMIAAVVEARCRAALARAAGEPPYTEGGRRSRGRRMGRAARMASRIFALAAGGLGRHPGLAMASA
jgi:phenylalanyl-tRNA synthetase alpha chain